MADLMTHCREKAAQAWCDPTTSGVEMNVRLAEVFARMLAEAEAENQRLREALIKVRAHTSYVNPSVELLAGLLQSVERIADKALGVPRG